VIVRITEIDDEYLQLIGMNNKQYKQIELNCEVCGKNNFEKILSKGRVGKVGEYGPINIMQCTHCGHVMINPRYEPQFYIDYYKDHYKVIGNFGGKKPKESFLDRQIERGNLIRTYLENNWKLTQGSMLDLGCSYGAAMISFKRNGWEVAGIDPEKDSVEYGKKELGLPVHYGYGENLPYAKNSMDLVMSLGALEHVHDFDAAMSEICRVIKKNGYLFIRMRHNRPWGLIWEYFNKNHYRFFSEQTHRLAVMRYGFKVLSYTDEEVEGIPGHKYLVCQFVREPSLKYVEEAIKTGLKDSPEELKKYLSEHHNNFQLEANRLLEFVKKNNGDLAKSVKAIDDGLFEYTLLDGDRIEAIERAVFEASKILNERIE